MVIGIIRVVKDKNNPYVMLNKGFLNDANLSFRAKGMLAYLLSRPDDWQVYQKQLERVSLEGRETVRAAIKELLTAGYMKRTRRKIEQGRFDGWDYEVYETPQIEQVEVVDTIEQLRDKFLTVFSGGLGIEERQGISDISKVMLDRKLKERMD